VSGWWGEVPGRCRAKVHITTCHFPCHCCGNYFTEVWSYRMIFCCLHNEVVNLPFCLLLLFHIDHEVAQYFEEIMTAVLRKFIRITVSVHRPVVLDRWEWVVLQQFWDLAGEPWILNPTQCNLLLKERHKNQGTGPREGRWGQGWEERRGGKSESTALYSFRFWICISAEEFFDWKFNKGCGDVTVALKGLR